MLMEDEQDNAPVQLATQAAATIRGTIEFDKPSNAQIGALGIRIPVALTFSHRHCFRHRW